MREKLLVNDIHLGVQRATGTTPATATQLKEYLLQSLEKLMFGHLDKDVVINGDLFDAFMVALLDALGFYNVARAWLQATAAPKDLCDDGAEHQFLGGQPGSDFSHALSRRCKRCGRPPVAGYADYVAPKLFLGRGNHDWSKDSSKLSMFDFVCRLLKAEFGERVVVVDQPQWIDKKIYMIPHVPNQDLFNLELDRADKLLATDVERVWDCGLLLLHANYDNGYTLESDHSLNVSREQVARLTDHGWTLVFGHEHQARTDLSERVIITGNQWPSSVADCLNNPDGKKHAHIIHANLDMTPIETWSADSDFAQIDWRNLGMSDNDARFVRVTGTATQEESAAVIAAIADFRRDADGVFVVTNAVQIEGMADMGEITASVENIRAFDVWGYLLEQLDPEQRSMVTRLMQGDEPKLKEAA
jgi:hypothetical protein